MFKKYRILKWIGITVVSLILIITSFGFWFMSLVPEKNIQIEKVKVENLPYLSINKITPRGKILAVVTSTRKMGDNGKKTGYELTELSRAYYVFTANGFEVDIASPLGGMPAVIIDDDDMGKFDYAFLNDVVAQNKTKHTIPLKEVVHGDYQAVYFVGGKGTMFDFPNNKTIQTIVKNYYESNKVIGAVCHGPSALVNVTLDNGRPLIENKKISAFTNEEELFLIPDAKSIFPFLLQEKIIKQGANFNKGEMYLEKVSQDKNLITGQNPWSTWCLAERMIKQLGYVPKYRTITAEENSIEILNTYKTKGKQKARNLIKKMILEEKKPIHRTLLAQHTLLAVMKGEIDDFFNILSLVSLAKKCEAK